MINKFFFLLLLVTFQSLDLCAQPDLNLVVPTDPQVKIGKLANGLTYYIRRNESPSKKVELRLVVNAGSVLERDDQQGLAHFVEHMAFNGSKNFKKNELISYLQSVGVEFGADLNASASFDETVFRLSIPTDKPQVLEKGFLILEDWAAGLTFEQSEIDKERGVVLEELRLRQSADQRLQEKYLPYVLYGTPYGKRFPLGQKRIVETFNRQSLVDFYEEWYRPDLMSVIAVGDLNAAETEAKIKSSFGKIKPKRAIRARPSIEIPDHQETLVAVETDKEALIVSTNIFYKKPVEKIITLANFRRKLLKDLFDAMFSERLAEIIQSPNPPFMMGGARFAELARNKDSYLMFGLSAPENLKSTVSTLIRENQRVKQFGFTQGELGRQKTVFREKLETDYQTRDRTYSTIFADRYVKDFLTGSVSRGSDFEYAFGKEIYSTVSLADINAVAAETSLNGNRVIVITGPENESIKYPTKQEILNLVKEAETARIEPYQDVILSESLVGDLPATAKILEEKKDSTSDYIDWKLSNGVKVRLKPGKISRNQVYVRGYSPGGLSLIGNERVVAGSFATDIVNQSGVKNLSGAQLNKMLTDKSTNVVLFLGEMFEGVEGRTSPQNLETVLQLIYLKFTDVNFQKDQIDSFVAQQKQLLPVLLADSVAYFNEEVSQFLNQNNPRYVSRFDAKKMDTINLEDVRAVHRDRFGDASDFTFEIDGDFETEKIKPLVLKYLGNLPGKKRTETGKDLGYREITGKVEKVIKKGIEQKSFVKIQFRGSAVYSVRENRLLNALGELMNIKLNELLREEKSGVYNISAGGGISKLPSQNYLFSISFPCAPENVDALIKAALEEIKKVQSGQIAEKDVVKVREAALIGNRELFNDRAYFFSMIYNDLIYGKDEEEEANTTNQTITKAELQKAAQKYLKTSERQQFVLLPEEKK